MLAACARVSAAAALPARTQATALRKHLAVQAASADTDVRGTTCRGLRLFWVAAAHVLLLCVL